jgi:hypothetical protein
MTKWRRFEILLPVRLNDGSPVPRKWFGEAIREVTDHFGFSSYVPQRIEGRWQHGGVLYRDDLVRLFVDVPDLVKNRRWMRQFKARWKERLQQLELWMVSFRIEIE